MARAESKELLKEEVRGEVEGTKRDRGLRRVLMISPHFPPDSSAGAHRVRLLAPHLERYGWRPTVLTVDPSYYEGQLDPGLADLVPESVRVIRVPAIPARLSRLAGIGDLGLRSFVPLMREANRLLDAEAYDAVFITIYPTYPALLGPMLKKRYRIPFVLDYQDPWVGSWGKTVGGGESGAVDWRSRGSRRAALALEPRAVRAADAITAVSAQTLSGVQQRIPEVANTPVFTIPIGGEPADFDKLRENVAANRYFNPRDGSFHLCYVGTILPLGIETLRAVLQAIALLRDERPELYAKLKLHFFGTSNERIAGSPPRVEKHAKEFGVADIVTEHPMRIDYPVAIKVHVDASALLLMGSSEPHYTASKLYPALLSRRPILAAYHRESTVSNILQNIANSKHCLVRYDENDPPMNHTSEIKSFLVGLIENQSMELTESTMRPDLMAENLAGVLGDALDTAVSKFREGTK